MPEIKLKHVVSFSSEDKVHKAENLLKPETYRKWKCATPGEKNATVLLQFEKASQIQSIDIGNESSAFVEVLVGRSSDPVSNFQVLLVASSFMSPLESRNETHTNRVRMFGPEKLCKNVKEEKWDCVQVVCTQPFNKNITYGLTFIKFLSPSDKNEEYSKTPEAQNATLKLGAYNLKPEEEEEDSLPTVGSWFGKLKQGTSVNATSTLVSKDEPGSYAATVLASNSNIKMSPQITVQKRKNDEKCEVRIKKPSTNLVNKDYIVYKDVLGIKQDEMKKNGNLSGRISSPTSAQNNKKTSIGDKPSTSNNEDKPSTSIPAKIRKKIPFDKIMEKIVFVLSGFVNPLRSELRDKALEMGAGYKGDWDSSCTHLVCAFLNTPKYEQVSKLKGRIVSKDWINDCYKKKTLLPWREYKMSKYSSDESEESDNEVNQSDVDSIRVKNILSNGKQIENKTVSSPNRKDENNASDKNKLQSSIQKVADITRDESETEDEEALQDYMADTDVDSDSGGDTEDEIRKVENARKQVKGKAIKENSVLINKPDVSHLPLPELPNLFKQKHFFLYGAFSSSNYHDLQRYITAYNGVIESYMSDKIKYVITEEKWDKNFEEALSENEDLIFVKPLWIYKCHETQKFVPFQSYIVIPD